MAMNATVKDDNLDTGMSGLNIDDDELQRYQSLISWPNRATINSEAPSDNHQEELRTAPLLWWDVKEHLNNKVGSACTVQQYAVLGHATSATDEPSKPVLLNTNSPWSAFLCGSQGSGKSHTLSCMLENCLLDAPELGVNPNPLAGLVLHYDGSRGSGVCEAAYLCSSVKTTVLVSASNYGNLAQKYKSMAEAHGGRIEVKKLLIAPEHLDTERVKTLMAVAKDGEAPLYIQTLVKIIRDIAIANGGAGTFDYTGFKQKIEGQMFSERQNQPLKLRMDLLESFLDIKPKDTPPGNGPSKWIKSPDYLTGKPGELLIIDLTDPVVDVDAACVLFDTCLSIFLSQTGCGKIVALDEAHNYLLKGNAAADQFTGKLLKSIREQRHQGTRIVIATQEPGLDTSFLDLCSITMVHRCTSPAWFDVLKKHLAGLYLQGAVSEEDQALKDTGKSRDRTLFQQIVGLELGESLLFCPTAAINVNGNSIGRMLDDFIRFRTRKRVTADGGRTRLADEA